MSQINCRVSTLETSRKKYIESHNFRVSLDEKMKSNLKENLRNFFFVLKFAFGEKCEFYLFYYNVF